MPSHAFSDLFGEIDAKYALLTTAASTGMSNYVVPVGWIMLAISLLIYALMIVEGKVHEPARDWIVKGIGIMLILTTAGPFYGKWVLATANAIPNAMSAAMGNTGNPNLVLDMLASHLIDLVAGIASGMVDAFSGWNVGGGFLLFFAMLDVIVVGTALMVACAFNMLYAKFGMFLVLSPGPFFIACYMWTQLRNYFYSWFNTLLYMIFLSVLSVLFVVFFIGIAQTFMDSLKVMVKAMTAAGGASSYPIAVAQAIKAWATGAAAPASVGAVSSNFLNIFRLVVEMNFVFIPMFLVALEMRTLVSSMTSGSGGSAGGSLARILRMG